MLCKQENNQSVETNSGMTEMMELVDKSTKIVTSNILHTLKNLEKNTS